MNIFKKYENLRLYMLYSMVLGLILSQSSHGLGICVIMHGGKLKLEQQN